VFAFGSLGALGAARTGGVTVAITVASKDRLVVLTGTGYFAVFASLAHLEVSMVLASLALGTLSLRTVATTLAATGWCRHVTINATLAITFAAMMIDVGVSGVAHVSVNWVEVIAGRVIAGGLIAAFGAFRGALARSTF
jgi:hypothetical protein